MRHKGFAYYIISQFSIFIFYAIIASDVSALSLTISRPQISSMLSLTFPFQTRLGNSDIQLTDPIPHFYESSQEIGITLNILLTEQGSGKRTKARAMVRGGLHFDNQQQQLQLIKPKIVRLDWVNKPAAADQDLEKQIERIVGQELPIIVLIDIRQLTGNTFTAALRDIRIKDQAIEVSF